MFGKERVRNNVALVIIAFVNGLYFFKYSTIYLGHSFLLTPIYLLIFIVIIFYIDKYGNSHFKYLNQKHFFIFSSILILISIYWITFIPKYGEVGRLSGIEVWLNRFLNGRFPYQYIVAPSGFPVLFIISAPFYFLKNVGYLEVVGLIFYLGAVAFLSKTIKENLFRITILLLTPIFYYSFVVRDELFFNMMIIIVLILFAQRYFDPGKYSYKFEMFGLLFGLLLSTRSVAGMIYAVYLTYFFKQNLPRGYLFIFLILLAFYLTLVPFFLWDQISFLLYGPFAIQQKVAALPVWTVAIILVIAIYSGWVASNLQEVFFASGFVLFLSVLISMILKIFAFGFMQAVVNDVFDISYFIFCVPFLLLSIGEYNNQTEFSFLKILKAG